VGVAGEKKILLYVAHIQYAPLIFELSVAHITLCTTHNPGRGQASRAKVGPIGYQWRIFCDVRH
jgi:hypothetical protein